MAQRLDVHYVSYYTAGSAAREAAPVQPFKTLRLPRQRKQKKIMLSVDPIALAGVLMSVVLIVCMIAGAIELVQVRQEAAQMEAYVQMLRQENQELTIEYKNGYDLDEVKRTAIALGLVPREQVKHITIPMPETQEVREVNLWDQICTFLTDLFA